MALGSSPCTRRPGRGLPSGWTPISTDMAVSRLPSVAERPHVRRLGPPGAQAGKAEFGLYAAFGGQQLVPFVHDDGFEAPEVLLRHLAARASSERLSGVVISVLGGRFNWRCFA